MEKNIQYELFRSNPQFIYLSELMAQEVYPAFINNLNKLGILEFRFEKFNEWKDMSITREGKLQFYTMSNNKKTKLSEIDILNRKQCGLFLDCGDDGTTEFETPFKKYKTYCEKILEQLKYLEQYSIEADKIIKQIENIGTPLTRNILIEKLQK